MDRSGGPRPAAASPLPQQPVAAAVGSLSSSWFCGGATSGTAPKGGSGADASGSLVIANPTPDPLTATVDLMPGSGSRPAPLHVAVAARSRVTVPEKLAGSQTWVGAAVQLDGGGADVEQQVSGSLGVATTPCASDGSSYWYFPSGTTLRDATDELTLLNPYPADAIVDLSFFTNDGAEAPEADQALLVPARSLLAVNLGDHLRRRTSIATTVRARAGRVVAWQTEIVTPPAPGTPILGQPAPPGYTGPLDPAPPVGGVELALGARSPETKWWWPDGIAGNGVNEEYVIYNPGRSTAQLRLTFGLDSGGSQPVALSVGPDSVKAVTTASQAGVPAGAPHDASLVSTNGVGVVAERTVTAVAPSPRTGLGGLIGATMASRNWLLGAGSPSARLDEWVEVQNPGTTPARVSISQVSASGPVALKGLSAVTVPGGGRIALQVSKHLSGPLQGPLVVGSSAPVVVERDLYGTGAPGVSLSLGVPLS